MENSELLFNEETYVEWRCLPKWWTPNFDSIGKHLLNGEHLVKEEIYAQWGNFYWIVVVKLNGEFWSSTQWGAYAEGDHLLNGGTSAQLEMYLGFAFYSMGDVCSMGNVCSMGKLLLTDGHLTQKRTVECLLAMHIGILVNLNFKGILLVTSGKLVIGTFWKHIQL